MNELRSSGHSSVLGHVFLDRSWSDINQLAQRMVVEPCQNKCIIYIALLVRSYKNRLGIPNAFLSSSLPVVCHTSTIHATNYPCELIPDFSCHATRILHLQYHQALAVRIVLCDRIGKHGIMQQHMKVVLNPCSHGDVRTRDSGVSLLPLILLLLSPPNICRPNDNSICNSPRMWMWLYVRMGKK